MPTSSHMYIFLYGRCGHRPLQLSIERTSSEFHTPNIQRAQTERLHGVPCDWEARSGGRPKGVPYGTHYRRMVRRSKMLFQARKRYFASPAPFSSISFPARGAGTKLQPSAAVAIWRGRAAKCMSSAACGGTKNMELARTSLRSGGRCAANRTAPPAHTGSLRPRR